MEPSLNTPFEILFDVTQFNPTNEIPVHWMNQFFQLIFSEMNDYLVTLYLYNPNAHLQRYIARLPRLLTNKLVKRSVFGVTLSEIHERIAPSELALPKETGKERYLYFTI